MSDVLQPLSPDALYRHCDPARFSFDTTAALEHTSRIVGQPRAVEAVRFAIGIRHKGYNLFALGPAGTGRRALVTRFLTEAAREQAPPPDWCYVNCFDNPQRPRALRLPAGRGSRLRDDMEHLIDEARAALAAAFESEEYQLRRQVVQEEVREQHEDALQDLQDRAREAEVALMRTPNGFVFAPLHEGEVMSAEDIEAMEDAERERLEKAVEGFQQELQKILRQVPKRQREVQKRVRELDREMADYAVGDLIQSLADQYEDLPEVVDYLKKVREDIVGNVELFVEQAGPETAQQQAVAQAASAGRDGTPFRRYHVNVVVDHAESEGAPVVYEDNPNYKNIVGHVEHLAQMGTLVTDFNLIRGGALHRANGGYLILEARKLLTQPYAWEGLKRALHASEIHIESPSEALGLMSTVSLDPEPIPLDVKVVLIGERMLYYLLSQNDPDFPELFKVMADFEEVVERDDETLQEYAALIGQITREEDLRPLDRGAVARVIEHAARLADDAERLTTSLRSLYDLLRESNYWAGSEGAEVISAAHVQRALDAQVFRADRIRARYQEQILRDTVFISTDGEAVGQINGLSVLQIGEFRFGAPTRITARVHLGRGEVVNIEREVEMSGPLHSKGVLILSGFLRGRYAMDEPLSLSASLVFEQSYGGVDGDSASTAELFALLSSIAGVPIRQSFAVTGSINQHGQIQPIGGVNEKIEGFFDVCRERGFTGEQGVLIPAANVKHLMLRADVVEAAREGRFRIFAIETIDEGLQVLTGMETGELDETGRYPEGTLNARVAERLRRFAEQRRRFITSDGSQDSPRPHHA